jgi:hypothetical protein
MDSDRKDAELHQGYFHDALTMFAQSEAVSKLWELDLLGIQDPQCNPQ